MLILGEKIKKIRKGLGYTQEEFANMLEVDSNSAVSNWELDKRNPDYKTLVKIAYVGRVSLDWLLTGEKKPDIVSDVKESFPVTLEEVITLLKDQTALLKKENALLKQELKKYKTKIMQVKKDCEMKEDCLLRKMKFENDNDS